MSVPWHHYTHSLHVLLEDTPDLCTVGVADGHSPDLTVVAADGQVLCHKPVLACHSPFLRNGLLLHPDTDSILMPDFGKEDLTHLVNILYGRVPQASVSAQLLKVLGIPAPSLTRENSSLGRSSAYTGAQIQFSADRVKADKTEETENNYLCHNCSAFFSSQTSLDSHIAACGVGREENTEEPCDGGLEEDTEEPCDDGLEEDTGDIIYQCSLCSLVCSDLEELHNHMDVHSNEGFADEDVIFMDEAIKNSKEMKIETHENVQVEMITGEEVITEELDEHEFLIADEEVEVQDPSIETTEVIVSSDEDIRQDLVVNSNMHSNLEEGQKETLNDSDLMEPPKVHDMLHNQRTIEDKNEFIAIPKVFCQFCEDYFDSMSDLNVHTITSHFELLKSLHMTEGDNHKNEAAAQEANQEQNLFYRCTLCENSFDTTKALLQHVTSNHETKPQNILPVSCVHCSRSFIKRNFLTKHYRIAHRGLQQIFRCPQCDKILKAAITLENHELLHTGLKPFQCGLCEMKFYSGCSLRAHVRKGCGIARNINQHIPREVSSPSILSQLEGPNNVKSTKNKIKQVNFKDVAVPMDQSQFNEDDYEEMTVDNDSSNSSDLCEDKKKKVVCSEENCEGISVAMDLEEFENGILKQGTEGDDEQCCDVCSYKTRRKNDFKRHLETRRHKENHEKYMKELESEPLKEVDCKTEKVRSINTGHVSSNGEHSKLATSDVISEIENSTKQNECPNNIRIAVVDPGNLETMMLSSEYDDDIIQSEVIAEHSSNIFTDSVMTADFVFAEDDQVLIVDDGSLEKKIEDSEYKKEESRREHHQINLAKDNIEMAAKCPSEKSFNGEFIRTVEVTKEKTEGKSLIKETTKDDKSIVSVSNIPKAIDLEFINSVVEKGLNTDIKLKLSNDTGSVDNFELTDGFQSVEIENSNLVEEDNVNKDAGTSIFQEAKKLENNNSNVDESFRNESTECQPTDCNRESTINVDFVNIPKETKAAEINCSNVDGSFIMDSICKLDCTEFKVDEGIIPMENLIKSDSRDKAKHESDIVNIGKVVTNADVESSDETIKPTENAIESDSRDKVEQESSNVNKGKVDTHSDVEGFDIIQGEDHESIERNDNGIFEDGIKIEKSQKVDDTEAFASVDTAVAENDVHYKENSGNLDATNVLADKKKQFRERISELKAKAENMKRKREVEKNSSSHCDSKKFKANDNCTKTGDYSQIKLAIILKSNMNVDSVEVKTHTEITEGTNFAEDENTGQTHKYTLRRTKEKKNNNNNDSNYNSSLSSEHPSSNASRIEKVRKLQAKLSVIKARSENLKNDHIQVSIVDSKQTLASINVHTESQNKPEHPTNIESNDDEIASNCDLCQEYFISRQKLFVHMMTHVPDGIRANLPEGEHGWCPQCPGPVPVQQINAHVAECHSQPEIAEISGDGDPLEVLGDGFEPVEMQQEVLGDGFEPVEMQQEVLGDGFEPAEMQEEERNTDGSGIEDLAEKCSPVLVKLIRVNLAEYGVNVQDYM